MDRINRNTREVKSHQEVCCLMNASIPVDQDYNDWVVIRHKPMPEPSENQNVVSNGIVELDGLFYYDWKLEEIQVISSIPNSVSRLQALAQLHSEGVLEFVEEYMSSSNCTFTEKLAW